MLDMAAMNVMSALWGLKAPRPSIQASRTMDQGTRSHNSVRVASKNVSAPKSLLPVLTLDEVAEQLQAHRHEAQKTYRAMYSSILGGITTDPAAMVIPLDDHMVHRGHGVFDTAIIADGHLYELDVHLERLHRSASGAQIEPPFNRETIKDILIQTVAASGCRQGSIRYWLSAGPGGFGLSLAECTNSALYAIVLQCNIFENEAPVKVVTSSVPMKPAQFSTMKNTNYLPNALSKLEAESRGAFAGIWVDEDGHIAEGPNMNVAFVTKSQKLLVPKFDKVLSGCTVLRTLALASKLVEDGLLSGISVTNIPLELARECTEMMLIGSALPVTGVIEWDGKTIGQGKIGSVTLALRSLITEDIFRGPSTVRTPVTYRDQQCFFLEHEEGKMS